MRVLPWVAVVLVATSTTTARAQFRGGRGAGGQPPPQQQQQQPKGPTPEEEEEVHNAYMRSEPDVVPPADPLAVSPEVRATIGSDWANGPASPEGSLSRPHFFPVYEEHRGDYRLRIFPILPPLYFEHTRGLTDPSQRLYGIDKTPDTEGLYGLLYYRRRSPELDMDVIFPPIWRVRDRDNHVVVAGPVVHREAPGEHDNWLAPLVFEGKRKDGGYFHSPILLTSSHWNEKGAFTLAGLYFRDRTGSDVDMGVPPFFFHGDNGSVEGNRRTYTLLPPLLFYHSNHELDSSTTTVVGPVVARDNAKRSVFDVAPLFFHIEGKPETGGVPEHHTMLFPLFHYGRDPEGSLFVVPGYYRSVTHTSDTLMSLFYSHAETRNGATSLTAVGPVVPLWWKYDDRDLGAHAFAVAPFFYHSESPAGHDWLTPLVGRFETYGQSRTIWTFPSFVFNSNAHGWENDLHPIVYIGRNDQSSHTVLAPFFWDFADPTSRTTIGAPLFWRFSSGQKGVNDSVTQVAVNTVYLQKRVPGGLDWQFHLVPLLSYGEHPTGYFWNFLFGLAGYTRDGLQSTTRAFWIPFHSGPAPTETALQH